ncbi:hypothetical protein F5144DRAFT_589813 [Chaetomium tenue]|uniref:Uncharacterized protein n=1 Tax=Chaetomium tenue TaxID=1854479 RepID=A0ACB7PHX8_9PEZI|nr:hypothetical protein F5144DRAFT_589813 [Chaetomium globosum]
MYSPGLVCPSGWTTATVVSAEMTDRFSARDVIGKLEKGETAAFCCPTGLEFVYGSVNPLAASAGPRCVSTMFEGTFSFTHCGANDKNTLSEVIVGTDTVASTISSTSTRIETFEVGNPSGSGPRWNTTTIIIPLLLTTTQKPLGIATTLAPAVQLARVPPQPLHQLRVKIRLQAKKHLSQRAQ